MKRGAVYMIESLIALVILFTFLLSMQQSTPPVTMQAGNDARLFDVADITTKTLCSNTDFRLSAINDTLDLQGIENFIPNDLNYQFNLYNQSNNLVDKIISDSLLSVEQKPSVSTIGLYHFNEWFGTTLIDSSDNDNHGIINNGCNYVDGKFNGALYFDGINDYVNLDNIMSGFTNFTITTWVKTTQVTAGGARYKDPGIIGTHQGLGDSNDFALTTYNGYLAWFDEFGNTINYYTTSKYIADGEWHHVAVTRSDTTLTFYVDGEQVGTDTTGTDPVRDDDIEIGRAYWSGSLYFEGTVDELIIHNITLTETEISNQYTSSVFYEDTRLTNKLTSSCIMAGWRDPIDGLFRDTFYYENPYATQEQTADYNTLLLLHLNENSGTTAIDSSDNSNNGTIIGTANYVEGKFSTGLDFNGSTDYINMSNIMSGLTNFTITTWLKTTQVVAAVNKYQDPAIIGTHQGLGDSNDSLLTIRNGSLAWFDELKTGQNDYNTNVFIADGEWHHVAVTRSDTTLTFYVDGEQVGTDTTGTDPVRDDDIEIGRAYWSGSLYFNGTLDEIAIYTIPLSPTDISEIYNNSFVEPDEVKLDNINNVSFLTSSNYSLVFAGNLIDTDSKNLSLSLHFDDVGSTTLDSSENSNDGTINGATRVDGRLGKSMRFDGSSNINHGNDSSLNMDTNNFTIAFWIKRATNISNDRQFLNKKVNTIGDDLSNGYTLGITRKNHAFGSYKPTLVMGDGIYYEDYYPTWYIYETQENEWRYYTVTYDFTNHTAQWYMDGDPIATTKVSSGDLTSLSSTRPLLVGGATIAGIDRYFEGDLDEIGIWKRILTNEEIRQLAKQRGSVTSEVITKPSTNFTTLHLTSTENNTVNDYKAIYHFDKNNGSTVSDSSGNDLTGNISGASWTSDGRFGNALDFGAYDYVTLPNMSIPENGPGTIGGWFNWGDTALDRGLAMYLFSGFIYQHSSNNYLYVYGTSDYLPVKPPKIGEWIHVMLAYDGNTSTATFYINGQPYPIHIQSGGNIPAFPGIIGRDSTSSFDGQIDDVVILDRRITDAEAREIYGRAAVNVVNATNTSQVLISDARDGEDLSEISDDIRLVGYVEKGTQKATALDYWSVNPDYHNYIYSPKKLVTAMWNK